MALFHLASNSEGGEDVCNRTFNADKIALGFVIYPVRTRPGGLFRANPCAHARAPHGAASADNGPNGSPHGRTHYGTDDGPNRRADGRSYGGPYSRTHQGPDGGSHSRADDGGFRDRAHSGPRRV